MKRVVHCKKNRTNVNVKEKFHAQCTKDIQVHMMRLV